MPPRHSLRAIITIIQKYTRGVIKSPRTGRPKAEKPKTVQYSIRLDVETEKRLHLYCEENNVSRGEAIRNGIHLLLKKQKETPV